MNLSLLRYAFLLILLSLLAAFFIPAMTVPRLGLSAHVIGVLSGALMIAVAAVWPLFRLSATQAALMKWGWIYSSYANWLGCLIGAVFGAGQITPLAAAGYQGSPVTEALMAALLVSVGLASTLAAALALWGLRPAPTGSASTNHP